MEMDSIGNYKVGHLLGKGGFASVYKATCTSSGTEVAIKMVDKKLMKDKGMEGRVRQEVGIHSRLKHPGILELLSFFEDNNYVYLVLELAEKGELAQYLKECGRKFSEYETRSIMRQVIEGLLYLHGHDIMHRDLSLANLLLTRDMQVKIGDFGLAAKMRTPNERHVTMCGTPNFISPEVVTRSSHGLEADVWGLGCLLYTMLVGRPPFDTAVVQSTLTKVVMEDISIPVDLSPEAKDLVLNLLKKNPKERIKLRDIRSHPWMKISTVQDSGVFTMNTLSNTGFSSNSSKPGPRPMAAYPTLTEYSEENERHSILSNFNSHAVLRPNPSNPVLMHPSSPPVKLVTHPRDLPQPLLQAPFNNLRSKQSSMPSLPTVLPPPPEPILSSNPAYGSQNSIYSQHGHSNPSLSRQFSIPESYSHQAPIQQEPQDNLHSIRSHYSDPSHTTSHFSHQQAYHNPPNLENQRLERYPSPAHAEEGVAGICSVVAPLRTARLLPTRQTIKNAVASISDSGEVCLEFTKDRGSETRVLEVMRISCDGARIVLFSPNGKEGVPCANSPPPLPISGADAFHSYESLPQKYWKKYQYASRFVNLVKSKTPKITLHSSLAKCYLMESDAKDFECHFYSGEKVTLANNEVKFVGGSGNVFTFSWPLNPHGIPSSCSHQIQYFSSSRTHCLKLEETLTALDSEHHPVFPVVIGRKPTEESSNITKKESPSTKVPSKSSVHSRSGSADQKSQTGSQRSNASSLSTRTINIKDVGEASQLPNGNVRVDYVDGSGLVIRAGSSMVDFCPGSGSAWAQHSQSHLPEVVRAKVEGLPRILELLSCGPPHGPGRPP